MFCIVTYCHWHYQTYNIDKFTKIENQTYENDKNPYCNELEIFFLKSKKFIRNGLFHQVSFPNPSMNFLKETTTSNDPKSKLLQSSFLVFTP